ncbi:hypothetical protein ACN8ZM_34170 [Burkholderia aenigmatica]|uniref:hypothetical protein n=1 Tax=Burkholderia aenigmatica TaxID=2015348 RepID=UPI003B432D2A
METVEFETGRSCSMPIFKALSRKFHEDAIRRRYSAIWLTRRPKPMQMREASRPFR